MFQVTKKNQIKCIEIKEGTWAAKTAEVVLPEPPFPKKVINLVLEEDESTLSFLSLTEEAALTRIT